jgi:hypothetical protein
MSPYAREAGNPPIRLATTTWERECRYSLRRSQERRRPFPSASLWPKRGERVATFFIAAAAAVVILWTINWIPWVLS